MPETAALAASAGQVHPILTREELESRLWGAADILRGTTDSGDYKNHIFALLFLKRLSDVFHERRQQIIRDWMARGRTRKQAEAIAEDPDEYGEGSFYIPADARWEAIMRVGENRAQAIDVALHAIEEQNGRYLEGVLAGVHFNDPRRFGEPAEMDGLMHRLLTHFSKIPLGNANLAEPDILGNAYEYLIERFAAGAGKKGGEFRTPRPVVRLLVALLRPAEGMRIHDPTCGSGGMLVECARYVEDHGGDPRNLTLTGQERNTGTWAIAKLNMLLHNAPDADIRPGDTIRNPKFLEAGRLQLFDRVIANPPFSLKDWGHEFASAGDPHRRFSRGIPPATKGDMAFLQHMVEVASDRGMVGVVVPHGVLFRGAGEGRIRKALLAEDLIEAVIGLPEKLFYGTGIPGAILILNKSKPAERRGRVLFIDASPEGFYEELSNRNTLREEDILRIAAVFAAFGDPSKVEGEVAAMRDTAVRAAQRHHERRAQRIGAAGGPGADQALAVSQMQAMAQAAEVEASAERIGVWLRQEHPGGRTSLEKFCAVATLEEIAGEHDGNLNISRYVDPSDPAPELDVAAEFRKLKDLEEKRNAAERRMDELLAGLGFKVE